MTIEQRARAVIECNKESIEGWSISKILDHTNAQSVDEAITTLKSEVKRRPKRLPLVWEGTLVMWYHIVNNKLCFATNQDLFIRGFIEEIEFNSQEDELRYLFDIAGGLMVIEKYEF